MNLAQRLWLPGYLVRLVGARGWNIALRTAHIAATGVLLGGHVFGQPRERLALSLYVSVGTGVALAVSEIGVSWLWFHQLRGLMTLGKLVLLCGVPLFWTARVPILLGVVVLGSVGSHMPARFRYYSVLYRQVIRSGCGPGGGRLADESPTGG